MNCKSIAVALSLVVTVAGCDFKLGGGGTETPEGPPKPEYERAFDEFADVPNQITAQVEWAAEPIDDAILLADEIAALRTKLNVDASTFASMCTVAFKDGTVEIGAQVELQAAKAEIEATLAKIKQVGKDLQGMPDRVKAAGKGIQKLVMGTPKLVINSGKELTSQLSVAVGDSKIEIQADIETVKQLPNEVKTQALAAKDVLTTLPDKAQKATTNLLAAMNGEPYEPLEPTGSPDASAGSDTQIADSGAGSETGAAAAATPSAAPPVIAQGDFVEMDPAPPKQIPRDVIARRVKQLEADATSMGRRGDWWSATDALEEALTLDPENWAVTFKLAEAAQKAKDCARAKLYYERFAKYAKPGEYSDKIQAAQRSLGELATFECPARTAEEEALVVDTLSLKAKALAGEGDWTGAALTYLRAYERTPDNRALAYEVGVAAWKGQACGDAVSYFYHFLDVADPSAHRRQVKDASAYIDKSEVGGCQALDRAAMESRARDLYAEGQAREDSLDYLGAAGKYQRAFELLPEKHALGFRVAESYWSAQYCEQADPFFRQFVAQADRVRFAQDIATSRAVLARIDAHGCPNALWNTTIPAPSAAAASSDAGEASPAPAASDDASPPASASGGGGSAHCSAVDDRGPAGPIGLGLLAIAGLLRRRRRG